MRFFDIGLIYDYYLIGGIFTLIRFHRLKYLNWSASIEVPQIVQISLCKFYCANSIMQILLCKFYYANSIVQILLCKFHHANSIV